MAPQRLVTCPPLSLAPHGGLTSAAAAWGGHAECGLCPPPSAPSSEHGHTRPGAPTAATEDAGDGTLEVVSGGDYTSPPVAGQSNSVPCKGGAVIGRDALEGKGPQRRPQKRLDRRLEEAAEAVVGGYVGCKCH